MMKKLLILTTLLLAALYALPQITSTQSGDWDDNATWVGGVPPTSADDAIIASTHTVTSATAIDAGASITINSGAILTVSSGATLTSSGNVIISGSLNQEGTLIAGDAVDDMFHINGGQFFVGNSSTTTISGYYKQEYVDGTNPGTIQATSPTTATINIANAGELNDNTNNIFYFGDDCVSDLVGTFVNINILNGNTGSADEIFIGSASGISPGNGTTTIGNGSSTISDWYMTNNSSFGHVKIDIGTGNKMHFTHTVDRTTATVVFFGLNVESGTFQVESGKGLSIANNNTLEVGASGQLILASDGSGTGELIFNDDADDVEATISRFIVGDQWHQITPSTTGATTANVFQNYSPNVHLQEWVEGTQTFEFVVDPELDDPLNVGQGYMVQGSTIARANDFTISYNGNMRSNDFVVTESLGSEEFTFVGNPYSSSVRVIEGVAGLGGASNVGFYDEIWIWNPATGQYATFTGGAGGTIAGGVVAQGQGYFVKSLSGWSGPATFTMYETQRRFGSPTNFYKSSGTIDWEDNHGIGEYVMLKVTDGENPDAVFVNFGESGTTGFENNYDGLKSFGAITSPQLYLVEEDKNLTINYLQTLKEAEERVVAMHLKPGKNGEHILAANLDSLPNVKLTLEDTKHGKMHEFNAGDYYTFNASTEDASNRFLLHFMYSPTGIEDPFSEGEKSNINIYSYTKAVYISSTESNTVPSTIVMYDLMGREVYSNKLILESNTRIPVNVSNTYLIVKIINGNDVITQKVFIQ